MEDSKVWLVTGSSRGLGRSIAAAAAASGARVAATARHPKDLDDLVSQYPDRVIAVALDVTDPRAADAAAKATVDRFGRLDVVVNNAGYANSAPIEKMSEEDFRGQLEANLFGVVNVSRAALPFMRKQRSGTFVQVSSIGGRVGGTPGMGAYQTAKFAVEGFSEVLASEVAPLGIKVIIVEPGAFRTEWQGSSMVRHAVGPDYEATVGRINRSREDLQGKQQGDPDRAGSAIVEVVEQDDRRVGCLSAPTLSPPRSRAGTRATRKPRSGPISAAPPITPTPRSDWRGKHHGITNVADHRSVVRTGPDPRGARAAAGRQRRAHRPQPRFVAGDREAVRG